MGTGEEKARGAEKNMRMLRSFHCLLARALIWCRRAPGREEHRTIVAVKASEWLETLQRSLHLGEGRVERVPAREARGRILAEDLLSPEDVPALPISAMDGFAVRWDDLDGVTSLPVDADIPASRGPVRSLRPGTAARIMTGAPIPLGADTVIPVEHTDADAFGPPPASITWNLPERARAGQHVRATGEEVRRGQVLARAGDVVRPGTVGLATTLGVDSLAVRAPWRVSIVVTGDELLSKHAITGEDALSGGVRESNGTMIASLLDALGCRSRVLRSSDDAEDLRRVLAEAVQDADLVVTTGGVGHGAFDVVKLTLQETSVFAHLDMKPGGPQGYGRLPRGGFSPEGTEPGGVGLEDAGPGAVGPGVVGPGGVGLEDAEPGGVPAVHLPGTPVGALVGFHLFVLPLLDARAGAREESTLVGRVPTWRGREPDVRVLPGRRVPGGVEVVEGSRLMPYGLADVLILLHGGRSEIALSSAGDSSEGGAASAVAQAERAGVPVEVIPLPS